ncbi:hypothetical protein IQ06DRAFT_29321 [Phaeosphaeriaceae sp. SRC1lsM3a]|nr:hypothetical protein IQ06DRAFT_29321 [Stagonospora sp. SRC1lsM3a]
MHAQGARAKTPAALLAAFPFRLSLRRPCSCESKPPTLHHDRGSSGSTPRPSARDSSRAALPHRRLSGSALDRKHQTPPRLDVPTAERRSARISNHNGILQRDSPVRPNAFDTLLRRALPCPLNARRTRLLMPCSHRSVCPCRSLFVFTSFLCIF